MAEVETSYWTWPSVAQSFSHSSIETYFFFSSWESFIVSLSPPPKLFDACKCILVVFLVGSGLWLLVVNVKITCRPSSEGTENLAEMLLTATTSINPATESVMDSIFHILLVLNSLCPRQPLSIRSLSLLCLLARLPLGLCCEHARTVSQVHQKSFRGGE